ncbi:MAG: VWA domain-containing protein, partial [Deltaproteobacteria bacterium]|nr:VWA domain-containing protein [Deltaproteobacteria bacterium]
MKNLLTSYSIDFSPPLGYLISSIIAIPIIILTLYSVRNLLPDLKIKVRFFLASLRILAVCMFLFIFFQPSVIQTTYYLEKDTVVFLIDASRSMAIKSGSFTRLDIAKQALKELLGNENIRNEHNVLVYVFSKTVRLINPNSDDIKLINEDSTDILSSIEYVRARHNDISNIILISDGADNN